MTSPLYDTYKNSWQSFPVEDVTFTPQQPDGDAIEDVKAFPSPPNQRQMQGMTFTGGISEGTEIQQWRLWDVFLGGRRPKFGDLIIEESGRVWLVQSVRPMVFRTQWLCVCTAES